MHQKSHEAVRELQQDRTEIKETTGSSPSRDIFILV
jgi:hypothetical protein|tara:strand:- start:1221 stop:1328 length:108 start_codon:yes stop_codon:yes gene_type:complete